MKTKFNVTITGFLFGMIIISICATGFALLFTSINDEYGLNGSSSFSKYNFTSTLKGNAEDIKNASEGGLSGDEENFFDIVGRFFSKGYAVLKTATSSIDLFDTMAKEDIPEDFEGISWLTDNMVTLILIALFLGVIVAALVKWKV